jgi:NAD(P)-dependent dehydrogenase (short-subunit alcohol dehydrogenase family)
MTAEAIDHGGQAFVDRFPRGRVGASSDLDTTLMYLVDPRSDFVTGTIIKVDDGQFPR